MTQTGTMPACAPVLLIEDEPAVMEFVRSALERNGYSRGVYGIRRRCAAHSCRR